MSEKDATTTGRPTSWTVRAVYDPARFVYDVYLFEKKPGMVIALNNKGEHQRISEGHKLPVFASVKESKDDFLEIFKNVEYYGGPR